jgi:hypothetical protein
MIAARTVIVFNKIHECGVFEDDAILNRGGQCNCMRAGEMGPREPSWKLHEVLQPTKQRTIDVFFAVIAFEKKKFNLVCTDYIVIV